MNVDFLTSASIEFYEAIVFYDIQRQGLGQEFAKEVEDTIERIKQNPRAWTCTPFSKRTRRCLTNRFPYEIVYQIREDIILIVAVLHQRRHPKTWQSRLSRNEQ